MKLVWYSIKYQPGWYLYLQDLVPSPTSITHTAQTPNGLLSLNKITSLICGIICCSRVKNEQAVGNLKKSKGKWAEYQQKGKENLNCIP